MPQTPAVAAPSKSSTVASSHKIDDDIIDLEENEETHDQVMAERTGTATGKKHIDGSDEKMAEAPADDAIAKAGSSKQKVAATKESAFEKLVREDRDRSYAALDVL